MVQSAIFNILGISGSLRQRSFNSSMLRAASALLPPAVTLEIADLAPLPFYNSDVEQQASLRQLFIFVKELRQRRRYYLRFPNTTYPFPEFLRTR
jgi:chromate reductase, NAD(P)H dehydrogenase (quinone)